jgi:hypothetical protein
VEQGSTFSFLDPEFLDDLQKLNQQGLIQVLIAVTIHYGEQLLTLSTCSYHTDEGRFVVVAKKQE